MKNIIISVLCCLFSLMPVYGLSATMTATSAACSASAAAATSAEIARQEQMKRIRIEDLNRELIICERKLAEASPEKFDEYLKEVNMYIPQQEENGSVFDCIMGILMFILLVVLVTFLFYIIWKCITD